MKKIIMTTFLLATITVLFATSLTFTADLGSAQDFIVKTNSYQFSADTRFRFADKYELKIPFTFTTTQGAQFYDAGLFLDYYPFKDYGLFFGLSLLQFGYVNGTVSLENKFYSLNEINIGWTFKFLKGLIVEPSILIRDPSGTFEDEYELIKGAFQCYRKFRFRLSTGWSFDFN